MRISFLLIAVVFLGTEHTSAGYCDDYIKNDRYSIDAIPRRTVLTSKKKTSEFQSADGKRNFLLFFEKDKLVSHPFAVSHDGTLKINPDFEDPRKKMSIVSGKESRKTYTLTEYRKTGNEDEIAPFSSGRFETQKGKLQSYTWERSDKQVKVEAQFEYINGVCFPRRILEDGRLSLDAYMCRDLYELINNHPQAQDCKCVTEKMSDSFDRIFKKYKYHPRLELSPEMAKLMFSKSEIYGYKFNFEEEHQPSSTAFNALKDCHQTASMNQILTDQFLSGKNPNPILHETSKDTKKAHDITGTK